MLFDAASVTSECPTIVASNVSEEFLIIQKNRLIYRNKRKMEGFLNSVRNEQSFQFILRCRHRNVDVFVDLLRTELRSLGVDQELNRDELLGEFDRIINQDSYSTTTTTASTVDNTTTASTVDNTTTASTVSSFTSSDNSTTTREDLINNSGNTSDSSSGNTSETSSFLTPCIRRQFKFHVDK